MTCEYTDSGTCWAWYVYGNYIDEVVCMHRDEDFFYVHDHLYSPAVLVDINGDVMERYEYDVYGNPYILEPNFADDPDGKSDYANPYLFTGRRADFLDNGNLALQINRHRSTFNQTRRPPQTLTATMATSHPKKFWFFPWHGPLPALLSHQGSISTGVCFKGLNPPEV